MIDMRIPWMRSVVVLVGLFLSYWVLQLLAPILMPFVLGAALAYLGDPIVDRLEARRLSRTAGVCLVFGLFGALGLIALLIFVPMLYEQISKLVQQLPVFLHWLQDDALPWLGVSLPAEARLDIAGLKSLLSEHWQQAGDIATEWIGPVTRSGGAMLTFAVNLFMIPVVTFYLLRDWDLLVAEIQRLLPRSIEPRVNELAQEVDDVLGAFITGQLLVMISLGSFYALGLWIAGLNLALLIGMGAGIVSFIPYLGPIVGIVSAGIAMLIQTQELLPLLAVVAVFGIGQVLESIWLTPWLVGDKVGLHPVAVIFAVMAGGQLFGFIGVMLGLPVAAALAVLLRHFRERWLRSDWYAQSSSRPTPQDEDILPEDLPPSEPQA